MSYNEHSFDWRGFSFLAKLLTLVVCVALLIQYGIQRVASSSATTLPVATIAQDIPAPITTAATSAESFSSTTPLRVISTLTIPQAVPTEGKFIVANLGTMQLSLYQDGQEVAHYPIITKGKAGTPWETPSGFYAIQTKEATHYSTIGHVYMPYSMQFYGNYFIHGWTYYPDGTPVSASFSGGCIKMATEDAKQVFAFADVGTKVFVYDATQSTSTTPLTLSTLPVPAISAQAYEVADVDTGDVYAEQQAAVPRPIASITKIMSALVANEIISLDKKVTVEEGELANPRNVASTTPKTFYVDDLFYPLLMQSSNAIADSLAGYYGTRGFVQWMNTTAQALGMASTTFADPSGVSAGNISTPDDLFRLGRYLVYKKSFVLRITRTQTKSVTSLDGSSYHISNVNTPADFSPFEGGKVGHTTAAQDTMLSILSLPIGGETRRIAIIVLGSSDQAADTQHLANWITAAAQQTAPQAACAACSQVMQYRKIQP